MTDQQPARSLFRNVLDTLTSIGIIAASAAIVSTYLGISWPHSSRAAVAVPALPSKPVSLRDTAVTGNVSGRAAIVVFSDFQCPFCGRFATETWPKIRDKYVTAGNVLFAFKHLPLEIHSLAKPLAEVAECARRQDKFWLFHDYVFSRPTTPSLADVDQWASASGVQRKEYEQCRARTAPVLVAASASEASALNVSGTPTFFVGKLNGDMSVSVTARLDGAVPFEQFDTALRPLLK